MKFTKLPMLFFIFSFAIIFYSLQIKPAVLFHSTKKLNVIEKSDSLMTLKLSIVGDLMCHSPQFNSARIDDTNSFDFRPVFSEIRQYLESSDFTFGNLETVISKNNKNLSGYPNFNSPHEFLTALKYAGFDILFTADNHALDKGRQGLFRTIEQIKKNGMVPVGTYISQKDRDSVRTFERNGIRFALLAYTYGTNGYSLTKQNNYLINKINKGKIKGDLLRAEKKLPNFVIVYFHFGNEYQKKPSKYQKEIVQFVIKNGADIVLGSHPHVLQPIKKFKSVSGRIDSGFVAYSLGNFISNQRWRYSDAGGILNIIIKKNVKTDSVFISKINFLPTWVFKGNIKGKMQFKILPSGIKKDTPKYLSNSDLIRMGNAFNDTKRIITLHDSSIAIQHL